MNELIKLNTSESGKKTVSAKELYEGLGLNKAAWSRWSKANIQCNEYFKEEFDWLGVQQMVEGNETMDFEISLEFAKHIAMMAKSKKSHQYRNYFLECEKQVSNPLLNQSKEIQAIFLIDQKQIQLEQKVNNLETNMPLFNIECEELQSAVKKKGVNLLGGKSSKAYKDKPLRTKIYSDIQREIRRQFGLHSYKALKRSQLDIALEIVEGYKAPLILLDEITVLNNQLHF